MKQVLTPFVVRTLCAALLCALTATLANAQFLSNPTPVRTVTASAIVYTKELTAFSNYGTDGRADILYTGNIGDWTFDVSVADLLLATGTPVFAVTVALDDHYNVPRSAYAMSAAVNGTPVAIDTANLVHGAPFDSVFNNWADITLSGTVTAGVNTLRLSNTSTAGSTDWIAIDRIRLTIPVTVPEAGTFALLAFPLFTLGAIVRRSSQSEGNKNV